MRKCPACKLVNPDTAQRCDCGFDFVTQRVYQACVSTGHSAGRSIRAPKGRADAWTMGVVAGIVAGVLGAGAMMTIAWEHNPQGEFHGAAGIQWHNWLPIGVVWFVPIAALASFAFAASFAAIDHIARRRRREHDQRR